MKSWRKPGSRRSGEKAINIVLPVTVEVESRKHFLGVPCTVKEKQRIIVDGKTYREMKQEERDRRRAAGDEVAAAALIILEEEMI